MSPVRWIVAGALSLAFAPVAAGEESCELPKTNTEVATAEARDGRTLQLSDGRELRLAGIEAPDSAREALQRLVGSRTLRVQRAAKEQDRYGRLIGLVFVGETTHSVQQDLLEQGQARVSARIGETTCAETFLAVERRARAAGRGLWADPNFAPLPAEDIARLRGERGHFVIVEGKVLSVRESGGTLYMNFGRRWTKGFSISVPRRMQRSFAAAGLGLKELAGQRVRVRGWLEERRGPFIEAETPEQIELIETPVAQSKEARP